jgi:hypothetical protein
MALRVATGRPALRAIQIPWALRGDDLHAVQMVAESARARQTNNLILTERDGRLAPPGTRYVGCLRRGFPETPRATDCSLCHILG